MSLNEHPADQLQPDGNWHSVATTEPAEEGLYFTRSIDKTLYVPYAWSYWTGTEWLSIGLTKKSAMDSWQRSNGMYTFPEKLEWCGAK